ncbi:site-specific integrase [Anaerobacillus isosaccharinicus]|uniref:Site-specific integrase n=1 Tax=Anaerobacillus isosaccharinicus TaxID=1532552 RepID=A0A7S7L5F2_9BACI|nr:site-specific integrase [Anaerobacillus isosaccharinicus]MBA5583991.1 tyrosine-type recombinase/integrase [Anaerobacillus isosaccharinicus]MBA5587041.1 tyrosine-type recombinase/integrase [Anaerobacillus isosaccharinicus]MBA5587098.1 tyrosine-type recombinase/integrase [Anaerobacillus isosaccharinicus]QOY34706.1 tyrosine-type recombinase/integrase [Anaerobacillus isosaccharinicus]QOY34760.1 tyrosine-type recombinase/integrase [Anaerobacillus isosaccharinicus]
METKLTIEELVSKVLSELERLNYAYNTLCGFRAFYKRVVAYANAKGELHFSEEFGREFLKEKYNCTVNYYKEAMPKGLKNPIRRIRILGDYQLHGVIIRRMVKKPGYVKPPQFEKELIAYEVECENNEYSKRGLRTRMQRLFFFIDYLNNRKVQSSNSITAAIISDYVITIYPHHEKSISSILTTLRVYLRFLYLNEYTAEDMSLKVPKQTKYYYPSVPSVWNKEDVKRMLEGIDRGNPTGKRDYAILLLVSKLGIRVGDIKSLRLSELKWQSKTIEIKQSKTKNTVTYPILHDIGWALIDYLKNARPSSNSPFVFLRMNAPYEEFGKDANLHNIITKYTRLSGITIPKGKRQGLHSLRHTLASTLLEQGTPLPVISEILGHLTSKSTSIYLQTGIEGLRKCAIDPEGVFENE